RLGGRLALSRSFRGLRALGTLGLAVGRSGAVASEHGHSLTVDAGRIAIRLIWPRAKRGIQARISGYYSRQRVGLIAVSRRQLAVAWRRPGARGAALRLNKGGGRVYERCYA